MKSLKFIPAACFILHEQYN